MAPSSTWFYEAAEYATRDAKLVRDKIRHWAHRSQRSDNGESSSPHTTSLMPTTMHPILYSIIVNLIVLFIWIDGGRLLGGRGERADETNERPSSKELPASQSRARCSLSRSVPHGLSSAILEALASPLSLEQTASPNANNTGYSKTSLLDRTILTNVNIPITLRKGFTVSGRVRWGDGITAAESSGATIDLHFISETYQGDLGRRNLPYEPNEIEWFVIRAGLDGTFRAVIPAGAYSVEILESGGGILDPRTELVVPRLLVTKNTVIGPYVLRYGTSQ